MAFDLNGKSLLITGGTGSLGNQLTATILERWPNIHRLIIFSRDEFKQYQMSLKFSPEEYPSIRYFLGDVRDGERMRKAAKGVDYVIHTAALKQVPAAEYNPMEFIKTNIQGAESVINACIENGVTGVVALSTDKAAAPINLYGATKLASDKLFVAANNITGNPNMKFSVVRYGNVLGSRGSVVPFFLSKRAEGVLPITHEGMTRFNISLEEAVELIFTAFNEMWGGEIFVPKIPSVRVTEIAEAIGPDCKHEVIGIRPGEKLHEEMITETDSFYTIEMENYYVITPSTPKNIRHWSPEELCEAKKGKMVEQGFKYNSGNNESWLSVDEIREQIRLHVDPDFKV